MERRRESGVIAAIALIYPPTVILLAEATEAVALAALVFLAEYSRSLILRAGYSTSEYIATPTTSEPTMYEIAYEYHVWARYLSTTASWKGKCHK